jgi:hypothetical protein
MLIIAIVITGATYVWSHQDLATERVQAQPAQPRQRTVIQSVDRIDQNALQCMRLLAYLFQNGYLEGSGKVDENSYWIDSDLGKLVMTTAWKLKDDNLATIRNWSDLEQTLWRIYDHGAPKKAAQQPKQQHQGNNQKKQPKYFSEAKAEEYYNKGIDMQAKPNEPLAPNSIYEFLQDQNGKWVVDLK